MEMKKYNKYLILLLSIIMGSCADKKETIRPAMVETLEVVDITDQTAMAKGRIADRGSGSISRLGIELNDGNGYVQHYRTVISGNEFGVRLTGLSPNKTYRYRAYADDGTVHLGEEKQFTTLVASASIASVDPISITLNAAIVDFTLVVGRYKEWGVHYSEMDVTADAPAKKESARASIIMEGLKPNTTYNILPYLVDNQSQISYLEKFSFTTTDPLLLNEPDVHNTHPIAQLRHVKYNIVRRVEPYLTAYSRLIRDADDMIEQEYQENAVSHLEIPGYYSDKEGHIAANAALVNDSYAAYANALSFRLSGDKKYGEKAIYVLNAWANKNKTYSGADGALSIARAGSGLMIAAELMSGTELWSTSERNQFISWVTNVYQKAGNSIRFKDTNGNLILNNWADWGRYASILSASFTENRADVDETIQMIKSDLFRKIAPDGHMPDEVSRGGTGTWYTYFSLSPLTAASWITYNITGENLFELQSADGASIKKAVDYVLYYSKNPTEWPWDPNPERGTPQKWPGNIVEALAGIYNDPSYSSYVAGSRPIIYNDHHFTWTFPTLMPLSLTGYE
jgi:hypothetical protein